MKDQLTPAGTTPDVLQHYLTAGISLYHKPTKQYHELGLSDLREYVVFVQDMHIWAYEDCLPCLLPLSALCEPLGDGTVPLLVIMKLALPVGESFSPIRKTQDGELYVLAHVGSKAVKCWITDEWDIQLYGWGSYEPFVKNQAAILDYLRSHHFAVGLEPHQYIPKASASVPTTEGEAR